MREYIYNIMRGYICNIMRGYICCVLDCFSEPTIHYKCWKTCYHKTSVETIKDNIYLEFKMREK